MVDTELDDYDEADASDAATEEEPTKCPLCLEHTHKSQTLHPVMVGYDRDNSLLLIFHDSCHRASTQEEIDRSVQLAKYDMMLSMLPDDMNVC